MERRKARHKALHILYAREVTGESVASLLDRGGADVTGLEADDLACEDLGAANEFCCWLVAGVQDEQNELDEIIGRLSENWVVSRMPLVDRSILRMAVYEMWRAGDIPTSVTINEAVELAKIYGGEDSSRFVNGVLGRLADEPELIGRKEDE